MLRIQRREFINWQELDCSDQIVRSFEAIGGIYSNLAESRASIFAENDKGCKVIIGNDVLIAPNVYMIINNHNYKDLQTNISDQGYTYKDIIIEDGAWIGYGAVILPGVTIGKHSVVAARAVVTKNVEEYTVVGGVPAKLIKKIE